MSTKTPSSANAAHWLPKLWDFILTEFHTRSIFQADDNQRAVDYLKTRTQVLGNIRSNAPGESGPFLADERLDVVVCFGLTEETSKMDLDDFINTLIHNAGKALLITGKLLKKSPVWWVEELTRRGLHFRPDLSARCRSFVPDYHPELKSNLLAFVLPSYIVTG